MLGSAIAYNWFVFTVRHINNTTRQNEKKIM